MAVEGAKRGTGVALEWGATLGLSISLDSSVEVIGPEVYNLRKVVTYYGSAGGINAFGSGCGAEVGGTVVFGDPIGASLPTPGYGGAVGWYIPLTVTAGGEEDDYWVWVGNDTVTWQQWLIYYQSFDPDTTHYYYNLSDEAYIGDTDWVDASFPLGTPFNSTFYGTPALPWGSYLGATAIRGTMTTFPTRSNVIDGSSGSFDIGLQIFTTNGDFYNYIPPNAGYNEREFKTAVDFGDYSYVTYVASSTHDEITVTGEWVPMEYNSSFWVPTTEGDAGYSLAADAECSASLTGYTFNDISIPFPTESGTYSGTTYSMSAGSINIGPGEISQDILYPIKFNFNLNSFYVDYINPTTALEYHVPAIGEYNYISEEYAPLVLTEDTSIIIGGDYSLSGVKPQYVLSSADWPGSSNGYCYILPAINPAWVISDDGFLSAAPTDAYAKIRVLPLTKEINDTSPWWDNTVFAYECGSPLNVWPTSLSATSATVVSALGVTTITTDSGATSPTFIGTYVSKHAYRVQGSKSTARDPYWALTGPNGTTATDLEEWGDEVEDNYQLSEHRYLRFSITAPKAANVTMVFNYDRDIYSASLDYIVSYPHNATYSFAVEAGVNEILVDLMCAQEDYFPVGLFKMNYCNSVTFLFPAASGVEQWVIDETSFNVEHGGPAEPLVTSRFVCNDKLLSFCATHDGKDAVELALQDLRYGDPVPSNPRLTENKIIGAYDTGSSPMWPESPLILEDILNMQAGWTATYTSPLDTTYNKDDDDNYMCTGFAWRDLRHLYDGVGTGDVWFSPLVDIFNLTPGFEYTVYIEGVMRGGIQGILRSEDGTEAVRNAGSTSVHLYMLEFDPANPTTAYSYVSSTGTDAQGMFYFGDLKRTGGEEETENKRRYYGVSSTYYELSAEPADLEFSNLTVRDRQITTCNIGTFSPAVVGELLRVTLAGNRFGVSHVFYMDGNTLYRSSKVKHAKEYEREAVVTLPAYAGSLWSCYYGNTLLVGGHIADGSDFILKSEDEGITWGDVAEWDSLILGDWVGA